MYTCKSAEHGLGQEDNRLDAPSHSQPLEISVAEFSCDNQRWINHPPKKLKKLGVAMASPKIPIRLKRVDASDVEKWFRDAWPDHSDDLAECSYVQVAAQLNTIVDRHNAGPERAEAKKAIQLRRKHFMTAAKHARAVNRTLPIALRHFEEEAHRLEAVGLEQLDNEVARQIAVITQARIAIRNFLDLPEPPKFRDHIDPILRIEEAVVGAWGSVSSGSSRSPAKISLGHNAEGPLVDFIRTALEAMGLAREGERGYSRDTIADHLRDRHNRSRPERRATRGVGAK